MAYRKVDESSLTAVADAIRTKGGTSETLVFPSGFVSAVEAIQAGGNDLAKSIINRTITQISDDTIEKIGDFAFRSCTYLVDANLPSVTSIGTYAFYDCSSLETANFPLVTNIPSYAFRGCSSLSEVSFPLAKTIVSYAFTNCSAITNINFPMVETISSNSFYGCSSLIKADFPKPSFIGANAFNGCSVLETMIIRTSQICELNNVSAFTGTPIASGKGYIYVPSALLDSYKAATNWVTYAEHFRAIEDYPDIVGGTS